MSIHILKRLLSEELKRNKIKKTTFYESLDVTEIHIVLGNMIVDRLVREAHEAESRKVRYTDGEGVGTLQHNAGGGRHVIHKHENQS